MADAVKLACALVAGLSIGAMAPACATSELTGAAPEGEDTSTPDLEDTAPRSPDAPADVPDTEARTTSSDIEFTEPAPDQVVENPVKFQWRRSGPLGSIRLAAAGEVLAETTPVRSNTGSFEHDFGPDGFEGAVHLVGYDADGNSVARASLDLSVKSRQELNPGDRVGQVDISYYYVASESNYDEPDDTQVYGPDCEPIADVPTRFADSLCIEGTGKLEDGTVINYARTCDCGRVCPLTGSRICYMRLDTTEFPWGMGSNRNPLKPLRSWATDPDYIPYGTWIYAPKWDGVEMPEVDGLGGFTHDGCFRADDAGGDIEDKRVDIFAGTKSMWQALEQKRPTHSSFPVFRNSSKCWRHER